LAAKLEKAYEAAVALNGGQIEEHWIAISTKMLASKCAMRSLNSVRFLFGAVAAVSFWLPSAALHLVRGSRFAAADVILLTFVMPVTLTIGWVMVSRLMARSPRSTGVWVLVGVWFGGGLLTSLGKIMLLGHAPAEFVRTTMLSTVLGIIPIYTWIMATYDGSLFALIIVSCMICVVLFWPVVKEGTVRST
jgi:hypothetical protein